MIVKAASPRTLLEALIRERRETFEEFAEAAETFARANGEPGTLSVRHVQRLAAGRGSDGKPLGPVRPATRRLLERMLGHTVEDLLRPPADNFEPEVGYDRDELTSHLATARNVTSETVKALQRRLDAARILDRQLGAAHLLTELCGQITHMHDLHRYSTDANTRRSLAAVTVDACALAGWQHLDRADPARAWDYYAQGLTAAAETESAALRSYVTAGQSVVLLDLGDYPTALAMTEHARESAGDRTPRILRAWLAAAQGEALAASKMRAASARAFDDAERLLSGASDDEAPFLVFGRTHLTRWRGSALARIGDAGAAGVLRDALRVTPLDFTRARTALNADLANAYASAGEWEAVELHAAHAARLADQIGSTRHRRRIDRLRRRAMLNPGPGESSVDRQ